MATFRTVSEAPADIEAWIKANKGLILYWVKRRPYPTHFEAEDAYSAALVGVMKAVQTFDPARGCKFNTLVVWKIRGAIRDEAVKVGRRMRRERPTALKADITLDTFEDWVRAIPDNAERLPVAISRLTDRQRQVIHLRYFEGMKGPEISEALGISKQRVGQLEQTAIERLRHELGVTV